jgi:hypothetical protein
LNDEKAQEIFPARHPVNFWSVGGIICRGSDHISGSQLHKITQDIDDIFMSFQFLSGQCDSVAARR